MVIIFATHNSTDAIILKVVLRLYLFKNTQKEILNYTDLKYIKIVFITGKSRLRTIDA